MIKNKYLMLLVIVYCMPLSLSAGESWLQAIKNILFSDNVYTRHQLYKKLKNGNPDYEVAVTISNHQEYYLDMIEDSIIKREHNGDKAGKVVDIFKIGYGLAQLSIPVIGYCAMHYYQKQYPHRYTMPAALLFCGFGLRNLYQGFFYKNRMEYKLERDKLTRRTLREITGQI